MVDRICIVEGFATGATIHEATGCAVAVAFDAGNLLAVAEAIHAKRPGATLILCADDDWRTAGNPGIAKATAAARAVGGLLAVPDFGEDRPGDATDFNDLARHRGRDAVERAVANARAPDVPAGQAVAANAAARDPARETVNIVRADSINPEPIHWIWKDWLAQGKMHILAGAAGTGKTTLALAMIATITTGGRWPDGTRAPIGGALMWTGEDDPADTLIPRLIPMGADLSRVHFIGGVSGEHGVRAFDPASDVRLLSERFADCGDVRLLVVDPIVSAVASDSHKNGEVRRSLQPLVDIAAAHGCALLGVTHYSKGTVGRDPLERVTGSLAFGALARVVIGTGKSLEDGEHRRMVRAKSNIGPDGGGFTYSLEQVEVPGHAGLFASRLLWGDPIEGTARDLLDEVESDPATDNDQGATGDAADWLRDRLTDCAAPAGEIKSDAARQGFAWRTVQRARETIGAVYGRHGFGKGSVLIWALSAAALIDAKNAIDAKNPSHGNLARMASMENLARMVVSLCSSSAGESHGSSTATAVSSFLLDPMRANSSIRANPECEGIAGTYGAHGDMPVRYKRVPTRRPTVFDQRRPTSSANSEQAAELRALIDLVVAAGSDADRAEALEIALSDPQAALASFRALASGAPATVP